MQLNDHLSVKELCIRFTMRAFCKLLSIYYLAIEGRIWDLIVSVPDHGLIFYIVLSTSFGEEGASRCAGRLLMWPRLVFSLFTALALGSRGGLRSLMASLPGYFYCLFKLVWWPSNWWMLSARVVLYLLSSLLSQVSDHCLHGLLENGRRNRQTKWHIFSLNIP